MADDVLDKVANDLKKVNEEITKSNNYLGILRSAGEDTATAEASLRQLMIKRDKWQRTLEEKGYTFPK